MTKKLRPGSLSVKLITLWRYKDILKTKNWVNDIDPSTQFILNEHSIFLLPLDPYIVKNLTISSWHREKQLIWILNSYWSTGLLWLVFCQKTGFDRYSNRRIASNKYTGNIPLLHGKRNRQITIYTVSLRLLSTHVNKWLPSAYGRMDLGASEFSGSLPYAIVFVLQDNVSPNLIESLNNSTGEENYD